MIKMPHTYKTFNGNEVTELFAFHINKVELGKNLHLVEEYEKMQKIVDEPRRELKPHEIKTMIVLLEGLLELSYGVLSDDGEKFRKSPEIWADFKDSAGFDSFFYWLFEDPNRANQFSSEIMPEDLREAAKTMNPDDLPLPETQGETEQKINTGGQKPARHVPTQEELVAAFREKQQRDAEAAVDAEVVES